MMRYAYYPSPNTEPFAPYLIEDLHTQTRVCYCTSLENARRIVKALNDSELDY